MTVGLWRESQHKLGEAGLLCMGNSGRNTNGSQFFVTYACCSPSVERPSAVSGHSIRMQIWATTALER